MTLTELRERADRATPGPWELDDDERDRVVWTAKDDRWVANVGNWSRQNAALGEADPDHESMLRNVFEFDTNDARYIAACSPEVIKALIAVAEAAEKDIPTPRVRRALDALKAALA